MSVDTCKLIKLTEMSPKKVLLKHIYRRMLTVSSSLRFYQMFWCKLIKRSIISSWFVIFYDAVTDATLVCVASHAWLGSLLKARYLYSE